ncbi:patatin-like phospholipase [Filimonas lacunae]|nr:patatin-like phospholipase [Filimonas lacunae]
MKAIDSAGLKIDYVTGTSMGSIIGALYASGYTADSLEKIARTTNWDLMMSNAASLHSMGMEEKEEYDKYAIELPWVNSGFRLPSGMLESEELWLKFSEFFFPVYKMKDFMKFPKKFRCIATDVSSGQAVVLDRGEIVSAVRSSMAIPSVFTAVEYQGRKLVDGGIVRNFPVHDAIDMGADFVIGSNVSGGLLPAEKINNVFQILLQIAFFREDENTNKEKQLCQVLVNHQLENYTMGSFSSSDEIINEGIEAGRKMYPTFKKLADSLDRLYGKDTVPPTPLPQVNEVKITDYAIEGLHRTNRYFFLSLMQFARNKWYSAQSLNDHIRVAFGTRYYKKIIYRLEPLTDSTAKIIFTAEEHPLTFAKLGIHYNTFSGISLIGNLTSRDFFVPYSRSRSLVTVNIGENMRLRAEHLQYLDRLDRISINSLLQLEQVGFNTYNNTSERDGVYQQLYFKAEANFSASFTRNMSLGVGHRFEAFHYTPGISTNNLEVKGSNQQHNTYAFYKYNSLSNGVYPHKGVKINLEVGGVYGTSPEVDFYRTGKAVTADSLGFNYGAFTRATFTFVHYVPVTKRVTLIEYLQAGVNFNDKQGPLNAYYVGGLSTEFRNQILFAGLNEGTTYSSSVANFQLALRYQMYTNIFITGRANLLYRDVITSNSRIGKASYLSGYALTFGYNFLLGPLEISAMYSEQSKKVIPYVNLGIPF